MGTKYFYTVKGVKQGPTTLDELKSLAARQGLKRSDFLWAEGTATRQRAGLTTAIFDGLPPDLNPSEPPIESPPLPFETNRTSLLKNVRPLVSSAYQNLLPRLPAKLRNGKLLLLLAACFFTFAFFLINEVIKEVKWISEAPQRQWQIVYNNSEYWGRNAGTCMCKAGLATGLMRARTESEVNELALFMWDHPDDKNLQSICGGCVRATGGDNEALDVKVHFYIAFGKSYIEEIENYKQRNRPLY